MRAASAFATLLVAASPAFAKERPPTYQYDPYKKTLTITGDLHSHNPLLDLNKWTWALSIAVIDGAAHNPIIFIDSDSPDWHFFDHAADIDGTALNVLPGPRSVISGGGGVDEQIGVELTTSYVRTHRLTGMNIKVWGQGGDIVLEVPADAVTTFADGAIAIIQKLGAEKK